MLLTRTIALLAGLFALSLLWASERAAVGRDLQLTAEAFARPGETLAVRALLLERLEAPEGPALLLAEVRLSLLDEQDRVVAHTTLSPQPLTQSMEGEITIPATLQGRASLEAVVEVDGEVARCVRPLEVADKAPTLKAHPRWASPLQSFAAGAVRAVPGAVPPQPFLPRISGGVCIPEVPCSLLVWVGEPKSAVRARASSQVTVLEAPQPNLETEGLVQFELVVHGLEAQLTLDAYRAGERVAERSLRLPVGLGEVGVFVGAPVLEPEAALPVSLSLPPGRSAAIVDVFVRERFRASRSVAQPAPSSTLELNPAWFPPGEITRVQARVDRFAGEGEGARLVYRRAVGETPGKALQKIAQFAEAKGSSPETRGLAEQLPLFMVQDFQRSAAYLFAPSELLRVPVPEALSERKAQIARLSARKAGMRFAVGGVLVFAALLVAATLMQRGFSAADQARAILDRAAAASDTGGEQGAASGRLGVVLLVLAVLLAFLAGALLIVAKPLWF